MLAAVLGVGCQSPGQPEPAPVPIRADACAQPDGSSAELLMYIRHLVSATDTVPRGDNETRASYELALMPPDSVRLISDPAICTLAAIAYNNATGYREWPLVTRRVHVVEAGDRYIVEDPFTPARLGEFYVWIVFTSDWRLVTRVFS